MRLRQFLRSMKSKRITLLGLVLLNLAIRLFLALGPLQRLDGTTVPDDAYLSLTIARNIAEGWGPLYGDAATSGFQPLYVLLMAPVYLAIPNDPVRPVQIALCILSVFDTLTLWLLLRTLA